jgi:hypothetical protein
VAVGPVRERGTVSGSGGPHVGLIQRHKPADAFYVHYFHLIG